MNQVEQYGIFELILNGDEPVGSQVDVNFTAIFRKGAREVRIKGFYNGNGEYRVRCPKKKEFGRAKSSLPPFLQNKANLHVLNIRAAIMVP